MDYVGRIGRLRSQLAAQQLDGLLVSNLTNIRYLCGFTGSNATLLVSADRARFLTDGRYRAQSAQQVQGADIDIYYPSDQLATSLRQAAQDLGARRIGFESEHTTVSSLESMRGMLEGIELLAAAGLVEKLRRTKEAEEIALIRTAAEIADEALAYITGKVRIGISESELALDLEMRMRTLGADGESADFGSLQFLHHPIVAAGSRSALPHARAGGATVQAGDYLLFDLGCNYKGYCSDMTRTFVIGQADDRHREIYELVAKSQQAGLSALANGTAAADVDGAARGLIEQAGHGSNFEHGLGHGVGLQIHEAPNLRATSTDVLQSGDVVTVEPGVYIAGWGGVRIEDLVQITPDGPDILSKSPKELIVL